MAAVGSPLITGVFTKRNRRSSFRLADVCGSIRTAEGIIRANWAIAVRSWYTIPAKNGQNTPGNEILYTCKNMAATPKAPNR